MKIAIDARVILSRLTGIGRYTFNLIKYLIKIDMVNNYLILVNDTENVPDILGKNIRFQVKRVKTKPLSLFEHIEIPLILKKENVDIYYCPSYMTPIWVPCKFVYSLLDLTHLRYPEYFSPFASIYFRTVVRIALRNASKVITISENTKKDITFFFGIPEEKIFVTYLAPLDNFEFSITNTTNTSEILKKFGITKKFILYNGNKKPHKNIIRLIEAFNKFHKLNKNYILVITGQEKKGSRETDFCEIKKKVNNLGLNDYVLYTGYVSDEELFLLYRTASVFVFPSLYEGFGLPPLEAMACGCPVVVSNVASLPEVCGDAAYYVNPYDINDIARGIQTVVNDEKLQKELIEKGLNRVKLFSWEKSARKILKIFEEVLGE